MKIHNMNGLTHEMIMLLFEIQKVLYSLDAEQKELLLETVRDNCIDALARKPNAFIPI